MSSAPYRPPKASDLRALAALASPVVSVFVPVTAAVPQVAQNRVRHARSVARALARLRELGIGADTVRRAEAALARFANERTSPKPAVEARAAFWSPAHGLEVFGLPFHQNERAVVAPSAVLRPIACAARRPDRYRLLVLSAKRVALYAGDAEGLRPVDDAGLPVSLEDALGSQLTGATLQIHSGRRQDRRAVYHGQGGAARGREIDLERFHQHLARALEAAIGDDPVPLVLAGDARHRTGLESALRRDVGLLPKGPSGNPDALSEAALHAAAWPIVAEALPDAPRELEQARESGTKLVSRIGDLVAYAVMGRIRRLWVPEVGRIPGCVDHEHARAAPGHGDEDLVEELAAGVIRRGGEVLVLEGEDLRANRASLVAELR